jgi:LAGLIDADG endonuclease
VFLRVVRAERPSSAGWEIRPSFSVSQNSDRAEALRLIQATWNCGFIRPDRSYNTLKLEIRRISNLLETVVPHFFQPSH